MYWASLYSVGRPSTDSLKLLLGVSSAEGSSVTSVSAVASPGDYMDVTAPDVVSGLYDDGVTGTKSADAWKSPRI